MATPGTPSGVNQSSDSQKCGAKSILRALSSFRTSLIRRSKGVPSMLTPRSHIRTSKSLSSVQLTQTGFLFLGLGGRDFRLAESSFIGIANYRDADKSPKHLCLVFDFHFGARAAIPWSVYGTTVCLYDEGARQTVRSRPHRTQGYLVVFSSGREDRHLGVKRIRQKYAFAHHGRRNYRV